MHRGAFHGVQFASCRMFIKSEIVDRQEPARNAAKSDVVTGARPAVPAFRPHRRLPRGLGQFRVMPRQDSLDGVGVRLRRAPVVLLMDAMATSRWSIRRMLVLVSLALSSSVAGCTKHWTEIHTEGAFTIVESWKDERWNWEGSSRGVERWTIKSPYGAITTSFAQLDRRGSLLLVDTIDDLVHVLDPSTGRSAPCARCTCQTHETPFGLALKGRLSSFGFSPASACVVQWKWSGSSIAERKANAESVCLFSLNGDGTYTATIESDSEHASSCSSVPDMGHPIR